MSQLPKDQLLSRKEVVIPITLKGLWKGLEKIFVEAPTNAFKYVARKVDSASQRLMTGRLALPAMLGGIMLRNGSRVAHGAANYEGGFWSRATSGTLSVVGGVLGWVAGGKALFAYGMSKAVLAGTVGKVGVMIGAGVLSIPAILPGVTAGVLIGATALAAVTTLVSVVPALVNIPTAFNRAVDAWKGVKYNDKDIQDALAKDGLQRAYDERRDNKIVQSVWELPEFKREKLFTDLKQHFDQAAARKAADEERAAQLATAAAAKTAKGQKF